MRSRPLVTIIFGISLVVGLFALFNMSRRGDANVTAYHVLATTAELPAGTLLRAQDVTWQAAKVTDADQVVRPSGTAVEAKPELIQEAEARVYGAVLRHSLPAGEPIRRGDIAKPGDRDFLQVVLPPGARAIAIPVATGGASTGILSPGDRVDVVLTQNFKNDGGTNTPVTRRSVSETVVQNLRVLAIDAPDTKNAAPSNGSFGRTVTIEVTPDQVEKINVATELGKLSVALRSTQIATGAADTVKPQWAGDVSPALFSAAQEKPTALAPTPILILRGASASAQSQQPAQRETVKPE